MCAFCHFINVIQLKTTHQIKSNQTNIIFVPCQWQNMKFTRSKRVFEMIWADSKSCKLMSTCTEFKQKATPSRPLIACSFPLLFAFGAALSKPKVAAQVCGPARLSMSY